jgi:molybdopterin/thiamine biosynthesis adenylyltransferase
MVRPREEGRFDRSERIDWLDMRAVRGARVLVAGAGALGNEAVKCLLLSGAEWIDLLDMDVVTGSNLNRCLFFRREDADLRLPKAEVVARRANELYPEARVRPITCRVQRLTAGDLGYYDVALGCLDNISARLHLSAHSYAAGLPYVDAGTDGMRGKVQVVLPPDSPCVQCLANSSHMRVLDRRQSCTGGPSNEYRRPLAAEITTTSVIAAVQVREALKILSGRQQDCIRHVLHYDGVRNTAEVFEAEVDGRCDMHLPCSMRVVGGVNCPSGVER